MLPRILEPEVMDTAEDAADYDSMDHTEVNQRFVEDWSQTCAAHGIGSDPPRRILDVGTGTALIPIEFARRFPAVSMVAIDLADEMLKLADRHIRQAGFVDRIELRCVDAKLSVGHDGEYASVISNSIIHHLPEPLAGMTEMVRVLAPRGLLFVRDLYRPETDQEVECLVHRYSANSTPRQRQLFRQSFHAALTLTEVAEILTRVGVTPESVRMTSDRHWTVMWRKPPVA